MSLDEDTLARIRARVGTVVRGKFRLDRLLGVGASAAVFEATHRNGSRVALKILHPEYARYGEVRTRFLREGYVANRVGHPGVTRIIDDDDDEDGKTVFLVMELLSGETLDARAGRLGGRLPLGETLWFMDRLLDVLGAAHDQGIVHRDIKPDNVFLTVAGEVKVLDFGIARLLDGTGATRSGQLLGTPAFMSPEQANGRTREIDGRSDLWSAGAVGYTLLTGLAVHDGQTGAEQLIYAATHAARPTRQVASWIPGDVAAVLDGALAFDRSVRWEHARIMQAALKATEAYQEAARGGSRRPPGNAAAAAVDVPGDGRPPRDAGGTLILGSPVSAEPAIDLVKPRARGHG